MVSTLRVKLLTLLVWCIYRSVWLTWRIRIEEPQSLKDDLKNNVPMVYAHWHGDEMGIVHLLPRYRSCAIVSTSKDGEIMAGFIRMIGAKTSRGSSTRGGVAALRGIIRLAQQGYRPSVAVDGPKGPYHKVKPGVFEVSKLIGGRIYPLTVAVSRSYIFERSWNKTFLPLPFSRIQVVWGEPLPALGRESDAHSEKLAMELEKALTNAGQKARNLIATLSAIMLAF